MLSGFRERVSLNCELFNVGLFAKLLIGEARLAEGDHASWLRLIGENGCWEWSILWSLLLGEGKHFDAFVGWIEAFWMAPTRMFWLIWLF